MRRVASWVGRESVMGLFLAIAATLSCEGQSPTAPAGEQYYPLGSGYWWQYVDSSASDTITVVLSNPRVVNGESSWKSTRYSTRAPQDSSSVRVARSAGGIEILSADHGEEWLGVHGGRSYVPPEAFPILWLKLPVSTGESWVVVRMDSVGLGLDLDGDGLENTYDISYEREALAMESVTIPGKGVFERCIKVSSEVEVTLNSEGYVAMTPYELTEWYAEGLGLVKRRFRWSSGLGEEVAEEILIDSSLEP